MANILPDIKVVSGSEILLGNLGRKLSHGGELNNSEQLMAISNAAKQTAGYYGPTPEEFTVRQPGLPESVKGVLADYAG
ncbi:MAG: hypothetical protein K6F46_04005 [Desulfovibrio sp.]|nr:hypothetical protein [Desulfovibrio sp.]